MYPAKLVFKHIYLYFGKGELFMRKSFFLFLALGLVTFLSIMFHVKAEAEKVVLVSNRDGNNEIYVMNPDGSNPIRLTNNTYDDSYPTWSPDGMKIAFVSNRDGNHEIYIMSADGNNQTRLTNNTYDDSCPSWSPDGMKIAFVSNRDGNHEIYIMNADGNNQTRLTNNTYDDSCPSWSPDGKSISFVSDRDGNHEIYIMNAAGGSQTRLTHNTYDDSYPSWSPDGMKIAFVSNRDGNKEIYTMYPDGAGQTQLTHNQVDNSSPSWSYDGSKIIFASNLTGHNQIYGINSDGTNQSRLTNNTAADLQPSWGGIQRPSITSKIVFDGYLPDNSRQIFIMNSDGANLTRLTYYGAANYGPSLSPDGTKVLFTAGGDQPGIYVMYADGYGLTRLTAENDSDAVWSPDGTKIAFASRRSNPLGASAQIYIMNSDGSNPVRLTLSNGDNFHPAWSPDGTKITFSSTRDAADGSEIYRMNADGSGQTRLTFTNNNSNSSWSPDGTKITFQSKRDHASAGDNDEIYVMNADGSNQTRLTFSTGEDTCRTPAWSPDGQEIVFSGFFSQRSNSQNIIKISVTGGNYTYLNTSFNSYNPSWSKGLVVLKPALTSSSTLAIPVNITTIATGNSIVLTWKAVTGASGYEVEADGIIIGNGANTSFTHNGLTPNTLHKYRIRAKSGSNFSAWSTLVTQYTASAVTSTSISLTWGVVAGATGYDIEVDGSIISTTTTSYTHSGLAPNTGHNYRLRSKNSGENSEWSGTLTQMTLMDATPSNINFLSTGNSIVLSWRAVPDATGYDVEVDGIITDNGMNPSFIHNSLLPNTAHKYRIRSKSGSNFSAWTALSTYYTATPATSSSITLTWGAVAGATGYDIEVDGVITSTTTITYIHSGLMPNTRHNYRVRSKNAGGTGDWSGLITQWTLLTTPVHVNLLSASTSITLTWDGVADATGYDVEADGAVIDNGIGTSYTHSGLTPNSAHKYRVRARSDLNTSAWTTLVTQYTAPGIPANLAVTTATSTSISLAWGAVSGATGYDIEVDGVIQSITATTYVHSGLTADTAHSYRVRSKNSIGTSDWSAPIIQMTLLNITPANISLTSTSTSISLTWGAVSGATGYDVEADGAVIDNGTATSYTHSGLTPNTAHKYRVRARKEPNFGAWTTLVTQYTAPGTPANISATATSTSITLSWGAVSGATGYDIEVDGVIQSITATTYVHSGLTADTAHSYRVRSKNSIGTGDWSNIITQMALLSTTPANVSLTSTSTSITLTWGAVSGATGYDVEADGTVIDSGTSTTYTHSDLIPNTAHKYRVRAKKGSNFSAWTALATQYTAPGTPANPSVTATTTAITLTWDGVSGAAGYDIEVDGVVQSITATTYTHSGLTANTSHHYRIRSKNAVGISEWSSLITYMTLLATTPANVSLTSASTFITLTWEAVAGAAGYDVEADGAIIDNGANTTYTHTGLNPNTTHKYRVRAKSDSNFSAWTALVTQYTAPGTPANLAVTTATSTSITLTWSTVSGATGYEIEADGTILNATTATYTHSGLTANTSHNYRIRAKNSGGASDWSNPVTQMTLLGATPLNVTTISTGTSITLDWGTVPDATGYDVEVDGVVHDNGTGRTYTHSGLAPNSAHKYRVRAKNDANFSAWTALINQSTATSATSNSITLVWGAVTGATGYDLEVDGTVISTTAITYIHSGLMANSSHSYRFRSKNTDGTSEWSSIVTQKTLLATPANFGLTSTNSTITLTWGTVSDATGYELEADGTIIDNGTGTTYIHSGLTPNTAHKYRVRAKSDSNASAWTTLVTQYTAPGIPSNLNVTTVTSNSISLTWGAVGGATGYDIEVDGVVQSTATAAYTHSGLTANTSHNYRVRSKNTFGTSDWSDTITHMTLLTTIPANVSLTSTSTSITVTWDAVTDVTGYDIEADGTVIYNGTSTSFTHYDLTPNTAHKYRVRARNGSTFSPWTTLITQSTAPGAPANINATATSTSITVTWSAVSGATGYDIEVDGIIQSTTATSYVHNGLLADTLHSYRIRAKNTGGTGDWSTLLTQMSLLSDTPANINLMPTSTSITLTWGAVPDATGYDVEADGTIIDNGASTTYTHNGLTPNTAHKYRVRTKKDFNFSAWTSLVTQYTAPGTPVNLNVSTATSTSITVTWSTVSGITGYDIEVDGVIQSTTTNSYVHNGLTANTLHSYRVRSKNTIGISEWSNLITHMTLLSTTPANVSLTSTSTSITLTWDAVTGTTGYDVEADGTIIDNGTNTSYIHSGLAPNIAHKYRVRAKTDLNFSAWTNLVTQYTMPGIPASLSATKTSSSITLTWGAVSGATGYDIEADGVVQSTTTATYIHSGLTANTSHNYRVRSKNANGAGDWSDMVTQTTLLATTPANVSLTSASTFITLTWEAVAGAAGYDVEADGAIIDNGANTTYTHTGLNPNTTHKYRVRAKSDSNFSAWTALVTQYTAPGTPANLAVTTATSTSITLTWSTVSGATGYEIEADGTILNATTATYTHSGLTANTSHNYRIRAKNSGGASDWSNPVTQMTLLGATPLNVTTISTGTSITLDWGTVPDATGYDVEVDGVVHDNGTGRTYTHSGLAPNSAHKYRVRAKNDANFSAWTALINQSTATSATSNSITLVWGAVTGATGYDLEVDGTVISTTAITYIHSGLMANSSHSYRFRSKNTDGTSEWSSIVTQKTLLATPANFGLTSTNSTITLTWGTVSDATGYELEADGTIIDNGTGTTYIHSGLTPNTAHKYRVRAKSDSNASAWTTLVTQYTAPGIPSNLNVTTVTSNSISLTWGAVGGATGYDIEVDGVVQSTATAAYTHSGLTANTSHNYRVRSKNSGGVSDWSNAIIQKTLLNATPANVSLTSTSTSITVTWDAVTGATGYDIEADGLVIDNGTSTTYTHNGLTPNTAHKYRVRAKSDSNIGPWAALVTQSTAPGIPANLNVTTATSNSITLTWGAVSGAAGYDIEADGIVQSTTTATYTHSGLSANTLHSYRVRAKNTGGTGDWSAPKIQMTLLSTTPASVSLASTSTSITLTWEAVPDVTGYDVEVDGVIINNEFSTSYVHTGLAPNTVHKYRVRAKTDSNFSAWTTLVTRYTAPGIPANLNASTATSTSITLTWNAVSGATGYDIEADGVVQSTTTATYIHSGLTANTSHSYRVRSKNTGGVSDWSNVTTQKALLNTPSSISFISASTSINLTWETVPDATGYDVEIDGTAIDNETNTSYTHSGLTPNTAHKYRVRAKSSSNFSAWSALVSRYTAPAIPANLTATATSTSISLTWSAVTGATGYDIEVDGVVKSTTTATYAHSGLTANTSHSYRVRSKNSGGASDWSSPITPMTLLGTIPANIRFVSTSTSIILTWDAVKDATGYDVEADGTIIENETGTSYTHNGLTPNTAHKYRVRARSSSNISAWSALVSRYTAPAIPANLNVTAVTSAAITLTWSAVTGATGYDIEVDGVVKSTTAATFAHTGLTANTSHNYRVRSKNSGGVSDWSSPVTQMTLLATIPANLSLVSTSTSITLTWGVVKDATGYDVEADGVVIENETDTSYTHSGLIPNTAHKYRVRAKSSSNISAWSALVSKSTAPAIPTNLNVSAVTSAAITLTWSAVTGATGYDIEVDGVIKSTTAATFAHSGLTANTSHNYRVRSKNSGGVSDWTSIVTQKALLTSPNISWASANTSITLTWGAVKDATGYDVEVDGTVIDNGVNLSYTHSGLAPNTAHQYRVRAKNDSNFSAWTPLTTKYTSSITTPINFAATVASTSITLTWSAVTGATGYDIEVDGVVKSTTAATFVHSGLTANTQHSYRVRSKNSGGPSDWSNVITQTTLLTTVSVSWTSANTSITLTWGAVKDATGYDVEVDGTVIDNGANLSYTHSGLAPNTAHQYRVRAKNDSNFSAWTPLTTKYTSSVMTPTNLTAAATSTAITLTWKAVTGATGYDIEVDGVIKSTTAATFAHSGLTANTSHNYRVRSKNSGGVSDWSSPVTQMTLLATVPANLSLVSTHTSITLTWGAIADVAGYDVEADGIVIDNGINTSYTHSGLIPNTVHKYRVRAKSSSNISAWSALVSRYTAPAIPANLNVTAVTSVAITLAWSAVTGATGYDIEVDGVIKSTTAATFAHSGLTANTSHSYRVRSKNSGGVSDWSSPVTQMTLLATVPANLSLVSTHTSITLTWGAITDVAGYDVEADGIVIDNGINTSYTHSGLTPNTAHKYRVRAKSSANISAWSALVSRYTAPAIPTNLNVSAVTNAAITLTWSAVTGATGYDIEVDGVVKSTTAATFAHSGLTANTSHNYRVRSKNSGGVSDWTSPVTQLTLLATVPANLSLVSTHTSITLTWGVVKDATGYDVEADGTVIENGTSTSYTHSGLTPNTVHKYRVRAKSSSNFSAWSALVSRYTAPAIPTNLNVSAVTNAAITLTWSAVTGATGYDIEVDGVVKSTTAATFAHSGLTANTSHNYRVRSKNSGGVSDWSSIVTQKALLTSPNISWASANTSITLTWGAVKDATGYDVEVDGTVIDNGANLSYTHSGLTPNTAHQYRVRAKNDSNFSAWTPLTTKYTSSITTPINFAATVTSTSIALTWSTVTGATGYDIEVDGVVKSTTAATFVHSGLTTNTQHSYRVRSKNSGGPSDWSNVITQTTLLTTVSVSWASANTSITLTWGAVKDATGYDVEVDGTVIDNGADLSYTHSGLAPNTAHQYRVRAKNDSNFSAWTPLTTKYTSSVMTPTNLTAAATSTAITLTWKAVTGATGYDIEVDGVVKSTTTATFAHSGLTANTSHNYRVRSKNSGGVSDWSSLVTQMTLLATVPANLSLVSTHTSITLTWGAIADVAGYDVEADGIVIDNGINTSYTHSGLTPNTAHKYRVRAKSSANISAWSALVSRYTAPAIPTNLAATATSTSITLTWKAVTGATGYDIEVDGVIKSTTAVTYVHNGLTSNTQHSYRVRSKNSNGTSDWCTPITKATL